MKELFAQHKNKSLHPVSPEDLETLSFFKPNQILRCRVSGVKKPRSVLQNKWIHAIFRLVAQNTEDTDWDTPEKVKRNVKMSMKFFKDDVIVANNKVYFELRSFAFDKMEQNEANRIYEIAKNTCADFLGVDPKELESQAQQED